jgi:hypothetical protein
MNTPHAVLRDVTPDRVSVMIRGLAGSAPHALFFPKIAQGIAEAASLVAIDLVRTSASICKGLPTEDSLGWVLSLQKQYGVVDMTTRKIPSTSYVESRAIWGLASALHAQHFPVSLEHVYDIRQLTKVAESAAPSDAPKARRARNVPADAPTPSAATRKPRRRRVRRAKEAST